MAPTAMPVEPTPGRHPILMWTLRLFLTPQHHRLRMVWRLAGFWLLLAGYQRLFVGLDMVLDRNTPSVIRTLASVFCAVFVACPLLDRRRYGDLGLANQKRWWLDMSFGAFIGATLVGIIFCILWAMGWLTIDGFLVTREASGKAIEGLIGWLGFILASGVSEELLVRGYLLTNLAEGARGIKLSRASSVVVAWAITSAIFGLLHRHNPNMTWTSTANLILAGAFLALPYVISGSLAMPIGIHLSWNLFMGPILGLPVSGLSMHGASLLHVTVDGPVAWTGGAFGPEAGILGSLAFAMGSLCVLLWVLGMDGSVTIRKALADPPAEAVALPAFDPLADS